MCRTRDPLKRRAPLQNRRKCSMGLPLAYRGLALLCLVSGVHSVALSRSSSLPANQGLSIGQQHAIRSGGSAATHSELWKDDRIAVVIYAQAHYSRQLKCEAAIESLRSNGRWGGRIYLITEQVQCYQHERWTQCGLDAQIVVLNDPLKTKAARKWMLYGGSPWGLVKDRLIRAELWELLQPPSHVQMFVYMHGCDVLVGGPMQPFMQLALEQLQHTADRMAAAAAATPAGFGSADATLLNMQGTGLPPGQQQSTAALDTDASQPNPAQDAKQAHGTSEDHEQAATGQQSSSNGRSLLGQPTARRIGSGARSSHDNAASVQQGTQLQPGKGQTAKGQAASGSTYYGVQLVMAMPPLQHVDVHWSDAKLLGKHVNSMMWGGDVWAIHRDASAPLLKSWSRQVLLTPDARAGVLLHDAVHHLNPTCGGSDACMMPYIDVHTDWSQELQCESEVGCGAHQAPAVFNHLPMSVCLSFSHAAVSDWVQMLDLCTYQQLGYCPPLALTPFAMDWLPYPTCSKLELGLSKLACQWSCTETSFIRAPSFRTSIVTRTLPVPFDAGYIGRMYKRL